MQPWTKAYFELDKERPFFDALGDFRSHIGKCEEHVATALSEVGPFTAAIHVPECLNSITQAACDMKGLVLQARSFLHEAVRLSGVRHVSSAFAQKPRSPKSSNMLPILRERP